MTRHARHESPGEFPVTVMAKSAKSLLVKFEDGREEWIPLSQIVSGSEITADSVKDDTGELVISGWLAHARGLS